MKKTFVKLMALALVAVFACVTLASCSLGGPNADPKKAKEALEDNDYTVLLVDSELLLPDDVEATLTAYNGDEYIFITYYEDAEAANEAWEKAEDEAEELKEKYEDLVLKKSGKMIYMGTKEAVKAAK